jgi:hypothetical protein
MPTADEDEYNKQHVPESFNIYLASQQIISILSAIIFIALITVTNREYDETKTVVLTVNVFNVLIWLLTLCELSLLTALIAFHTTATLVCVRWKIYFPNGMIRDIGGVFMTAGIFLALLSTAAILFLKGFVVLPIVCLAFAPLWVVLTYAMRQIKLTER